MDYDEVCRTVPDINYFVVNHSIIASWNIHFGVFPSVVIFRVLFIDYVFVLLFMSPSDTYSLFILVVLG